jgi:hypothetical protein
MDNLNLGNHSKKTTERRDSNLKQQQRKNSAGILAS